MTGRWRNTDLGIRKNDVIRKGKNQLSKSPQLWCGNNSIKMIYERILKSPCDLKLLWNAGEDNCANPSEFTNKEETLELFRKGSKYDTATVEYYFGSRTHRELYTNPQA